MKTRRTACMAAASVMLLAASACGGESSPGASSPSAAGAPTVVSDRDFDPGNFGDRSTEVDNRWFPLEPGTRFTWEGHAIDGDQKVSRMVVFTVTDLTKVVNGVRTVVAWDQDYNDGHLDENELAFFAQDNDGNVWHFGQYPEEYDGKEIVKTPTWIAGLHGARAGITMRADPQVGTPDYAEGWGGSDVNWTDRGNVDQTGQETCVPVDCYENVLVIDEFNPDEPGAHQLKYYAPGVGGVRVGWRGPKEEEQEEMVLVKLEQLTAEQMAEARETVLAQEARAYEISPDVYGTTAPIDRSGAS